MTKKQDVSLRICKYEKCGIEFNPKRPKQEYHLDKCRRTAWAERSLVNLARPKPEDVERAYRFIESQIGTMKNGDHVMVYDVPTKTRAELDAIFAKKPTLNYMTGPASPLLPTEEEVDLRSLKYKVPKPPRKKRPSDFLKRIGFTPAELGTIQAMAKNHINLKHAPEILRKVSR